MIGKVGIEFETDTQKFIKELNKIVENMPGKRMAREAQKILKKIRREDLLASVDKLRTEKKYSTILLQYKRLGWDADKAHEKALHESRLSGLEEIYAKRRRMEEALAQYNEKKRQREELLAFSQKKKFWSGVASTALGTSVGNLVSKAGSSLAGMAKTDLTGFKELNERMIIEDDFKSRLGDTPFRRAQQLLKDIRVKTGNSYEEIAAQYLGFSKEMKGILKDMESRRYLNLFKEYTDSFRPFQSIVEEFSSAVGYGSAIGRTFALSEFMGSDSKRRLFNRRLQSQEALVSAGFYEDMEVFSLAKQREKWLRPYLNKPAIGKTYLNKFTKAGREASMQIDEDKLNTYRSKLPADMSEESAKKIILGFIAAARIYGGSPSDKVLLGSNAIKYIGEGGSAALDELFTAMGFDVRAARKKQEEAIIANCKRDNTLHTSRTRGGLLLKLRQTFVVEILSSSGQRKLKLDSREGDFSFSLSLRRTASCATELPTLVIANFPAELFDDGSYLLKANRDRIRIWAGYATPRFLVEGVLSYYHFSQNGSGHDLQITFVEGLNMINLESSLLEKQAKNRQYKKITLRSLIQDLYKSIGQVVFATSSPALEEKVTLKTGGPIWELLNDLLMERGLSYYFRSLDLVIWDLEHPTACLDLDDWQGKGTILIQAGELSNYNHRNPILFGEKGEVYYAFWQLSTLFSCEIYPSLQVSFTNTLGRKVKATLSQVEYVCQKAKVVGFEGEEVLLRLQFLPFLSEDEPPLVICPKASYFSHSFSLEKGDYCLVAQLPAPLREQLSGRADYRSRIDLSYAVILSKVHPSKEIKEAEVWRGFNSCVCLEKDKITISTAEGKSEVQVSSKGVSVKAQEVHVKAQKVTIDSSSVNLGGEGGFPVLTTASVITAPPSGGACAVVPNTTSVKASTAQGSYIFDRSWGIDFALLRGLDEIWQVGEYLRTILEGRLGKTIASVEVNSLTKTSKSLFLVLDVKRKNTQNTTILELGYAY
ncbi:UNVERIFIED_CONTAM: hypothetical protein PYX00_010894 [Menopon gallinae]|uniref:Uncharacterized protein n=1 Tax=Menopon gallinae TaxID=328185 RepID=A0AAW2H6Q4_9NEOP